MKDNAHMNINWFAISVVTLSIFLKKCRCLFSFPLFFLLPVCWYLISQEHWHFSIYLWYIEDTMKSPKWCFSNLLILSSTLKGLLNMEAKNNLHVLSLFFSLRMKIVVIMYFIRFCLGRSRKTLKWIIKFMLLHENYFSIPLAYFYYWSKVVSLNAFLLLSRHITPLAADQLYVWFLWHSFSPTVLF